MRTIKIEATNMPNEIRLIAEGFSRPVMIQIPKDLGEYILELNEFTSLDNGRNFKSKIKKNNQRREP